MGDSNTKHLKFGKGKGTFGYNMPGESIYAPTLDMIEPIECVGYNNIFLHCGINNVRQPDSDVSECVDQLMESVERIKLLCPRARIFVHPLLPSKSHNLNIKARQFNAILFNYLENRSDPYLQSLGFDVFLDMNSGLLREDMGRFHSRDQLHLGASGFRMLVTLIKEKVFGSMVDGRPFSGVVGSREVRSEGRGGLVGNRRNPTGNEYRSKHTDNGETPPIHNYNGDFPPLKRT